MASDLKAATAQAGRRDLDEQVSLMEEAIDWWTRAAAQCDGRAKERALRNIADNQRAREKLAEQLQSGPQCEAAHKGATTLQDLARQSLADRRFAEASTMFRKSEDAWDNASEICTGSQQELALRRRDQSAIDGHNAEHCAPVFERAREQTQKLRALAPATAREERMELSQQAETAWREAMAMCRGGVIEAARIQAQAIARERGTPWIVKSMPALPVASAPTPRASPSQASPSMPSPRSNGGQVDTVPSSTPAPHVSPPPAPTLTTMLEVKASDPAPSSAAAATSNTTGVNDILSNIGKATAEPAKRLAGSSSAVTFAPAASQTPIAEPHLMPPDFTAGTARFAGKFTRDVDSPTYSGTGRITWGNGDVFEGTFVKGKRHGKGLFIWANGQQHDGDWINDVPTGYAKVLYANGNRYEGMVRDGIPQGKGRMHYASGDTYEGEFDKGVTNGLGRYAWKNGQVFDGEWQSDQPNGKGTLRFANGNVFTGSVVNGVPSGEGQLVFATGDTYTGSVVQGEPEGKGSMLWSNGDRYVGEWKAGKKHGAGVFTWKTGERWEGTHNNDVRQ